ncbi:hypothetical protein SELMODRAFT_427148 [Selaginella moellendorffii]|uniref:Uncharacterized protein n=1 Tax=Selaginella moellendorffii TaxID=88036 RepID=D8SYN4_SELML|nr:hypothetical protein SELMODRAFT_427148 [Selaginella moellendorffii]
MAEEEEEEEPIGEWIARLPSYSKKAKRNLEEMLAKEGYFTVGDVKDFGARAKVTHSRLRRDMTAAGFFLDGTAHTRFSKALDLRNAILAIPDVGFEKAKVFEGLPWPSLEPIGLRVRHEHGKIWLVGRPVFKKLLDRFCHPQQIDLDGNVGSGKTYLLLMLSLHCMHSFLKAGGRKKRLVCLFTVPLGLQLLLRALKNALIVAFVEDEQARNRIYCAEDLAELLQVVTFLKESNDFYFIIDEYNLLDDWATNEELRNVWLALADFEECSVCLHGGSAERAAAYARLSKSTFNRESHCHYSVFTKEEVDAFLGKQGLQSEPPEMRELTGYLPLLVRIYLDVYSESREKARENFLLSREVAQQKRDLQKMVMKAAEFSDGKRKWGVECLSELIAGTATADGMMGDLGFFSTRWIVENNGMFSLVSELAKRVVILAVEQYLGVTLRV